MKTINLALSGLFSLLVILVWTTRNRTFAPGSIDEIITNISGLIIDDMKSRELIQ